MQIVYILLIILGLIVCFGGIYLRKPVAAIAGFINGLFIGGIILVIMMLTYSDIGSEEIIVLSIAAIFAGVCVVFDKFFTALSSFVSSLLVLIIIVLSICDDETIEAGLIAALIGAVVLSVISYIYYEYSFAIVTAFTGGLSAAIGITFLFTDNTLDSYLINILWNEANGLGIILVITIALMAAGLYVQIKGMKKQEGIKAKIETEVNLQVYQELLERMKKIDFSKYIALLQKNWLVIAIPMLTAFVPVIFGFMPNIGTEYQTYGSFISLMEDITIAIMLGCIIYFITKDRIKEGIIIAGIYNLLYVLVNYEKYIIPGYSFSIGATTFRGLITAVIIIALHLVIKDRDIKLVVFPIISYISFEYVVNWMGSRILLETSFDINFIIAAVVVYLTLFILYYHYDKMLIYKNKKNLIALIIVIIICSGIYGLQKWRSLQAEREAKGGWQNYEEELETYNEDDKWTVIENENDYEDLIEGNINIQQLEGVFSCFWGEASAEDIDLAFNDNSHWMTFTICDSVERQWDEEHEYLIYKYELAEVNNTLNGLTNFQYKKNTQYSEVEYTDGEYLYLKINSGDSNRFIKNIRGRYNQEEMIVDYDWYEYYFEEYDPEEFDPEEYGPKEIYLHSLSAVFNKNEGGKFELSEIRDFEE